MTRPEAGLRGWRRRLRRRVKHRPGALPWLAALPPRLLLRALRRLPARPAEAVFAAAARCALWRRRRRPLGRAHLALALPALPPRELDRILRESCAHLGRAAFEGTVLASRYHPDWLQGRIAFEPGARETLEALRGRPAVFLEGHLGALEVMAAVLALLGLRPVVAGRFPNNYYLASELRAARARWSVEVIPRRAAVRSLLRALRDGRAVLLVADQNAHHAPLFVPWFGRLAATERGPVGLALLSGAPLFACWCLREDAALRWRVGCETVREAAAPVRADDAALRDVAARAHTALERVIRRHPEQYLWIHDRYRTRPPGEGSRA